MSHTHTQTVLSDLTTTIVEHEYDVDYALMTLRKATRTPQLDVIREQVRHVKKLAADMSELSLTARPAASASSVLPPPTTMAPPSSSSGIITTHHGQLDGTGDDTENLSSIAAAKSGEKGSLSRTHTLVSLAHVFVFVCSETPQLRKRRPRSERLRSRMGSCGQRNSE